MPNKSPEELNNFNNSLVDYLKEGILELKSEVEMGPLLTEILNQLTKLPVVEKNLTILQINSVLWEKWIDFQLALDEEGNPYFWSPKSAAELDDLENLLKAA